MTAWHVEQFAALAWKLKDTPDVDGTSLLDNTVMFFVTEGGAGHNPEPAGVGGREIQSHSTENMSVLVGGGRALGLKPGRHIQKNNDVHPASAFVSGLKAVGINRSLGYVTKGIDDL